MTVAYFMPKNKERVEHRSALPEIQGFSVRKSKESFGYSFIKKLKNCNRRPLLTFPPLLRAANLTKNFDLVQLYSKLSMRILYHLFRSNARIRFNLIPQRLEYYSPYRARAVWCYLYRSPSAFLLFSERVFAHIP